MREDAIDPLRAREEPSERTDDLQVPRGEPRWSADGKELFHLSGDGNLMAAQVKTAGTTFERSTPQTLFAAHISGFGALTGRAYHYVPSADGKRFLISTNPDASSGQTPQINVVVNWLAGLKK